MYLEAKTLKINMNLTRLALSALVTLSMTLGAARAVCAFGQPPASRVAQSTSDTQDRANSGSKKSRKKMLKTQANSQGAASSPTALPAKPGAPPSATLKTAPPVPATTASASEIQAAHARGDVWVNTATKTFHREGKWYGTTKTGKFMSEQGAIKAGYHAAKNEAAQ